MALRLKKFTTPYGVTYENVYFKIYAAHYNDEEKRVSCECKAWISEEARDAGYSFIPELQMGLSFDSDDKLGNLWENSYNAIKLGAETVRGKTYEEIEEYNQKIIQECMKKDIPPQGTLNADFLFFVDAEDC